MRARRKRMTILMAEDDEDDRLLTQEALAENQLANDLRFVEDGEELLDYLHRRGRFVDRTHSPRPGLILLDLNMPRKDGHEALQEIKEDPNLRAIPVVIFTTSRAEADIHRSYDLGANSFITKPATYAAMVELTRTLGRYWFEAVALPVGKNSA